MIDRSLLQVSDEPAEVIGVTTIMNDDARTDILSPEDDWEDPPRRWGRTMAWVAGLLLVGLAGAGIVLASSARSDLSEARDEISELRAAQAENKEQMIELTSVVAKGVERLRGQNANDLSDLETDIEDVESTVAALERDVNCLDQTLSVVASIWNNPSRRLLFSGC